VKFGLALMNDFPPDVVPADRIGQLREQVRAATESGIDSVWVLQHYLGNMPTLQPVPLLTALAADAGDMYLGTNMLILPLRHPVGVAEEFATLDHISNGHAIAGFGMGYRENEFAAFGVPMDERTTRFEESVEVVRALWSGERVTFRGQHFTLEDERISLPPIQSGGPQVWIGAGPHKAGARRAARLGDAWIIPPHVTPERLQQLLATYREERDRLELGAPAEVVVRRELVLDDDPARAGAVGVAARAALTRRYAAFNAPDQTAGYRHLESDAAAQETADQSYLFTHPAAAVTALKALEAQGFTYVVLRMQWYDLPHERMLQTLESFRNRVLPAFAGR
jgi:alkanesulfonate monooxygenase SsuD/methylene tetrahydromethanopterin reductase-like flavin-dependent oxidoreductase (luciferase family)